MSAHAIARRAPRDERFPVVEQFMAGYTGAVAHFADERGALECLWFVAAVELPRGLQQREEFVDVECPAIAAALKRLSAASAAGDVALDPASIFGFVGAVRIGAAVDSKRR